MHDLTLARMGEGNLTVKRDGKELPNGAIVRKGEALTITAIAENGLALKSLTVNGTPFESGKTFTAGDGDVKIDVEFAKPYKLTVVQVGEGSLGVMRGAEKLSGEANLFEGDALTITAMQGEGYALGSLTVNGVSLESGKTFTVGTEDVKVVVDFVKTPSAFIESQLLASVEVLPNPCSDVLTLRGVSSVMEWELFTSQGRLVAGGVGNGNDVIEIATAHLAAGVYCVRLVASDGEKSMVVVKK